MRLVTTAEVAGGDPVTTVTGRATPPAYGVTVYEVIGEPPSGGADHETVALASPALVPTIVGAAGAVGAPPVCGFSTKVAASQMAPPLVPNPAFGVAPAATVLSSVRCSTSGLGDTFTRWVKPLPALRASSKPESA